MLVPAGVGCDQPAESLLEGNVLEIYVEGDNLGDVRYEEVPGVPLPGRTLAAGVRLAW